MTAGRIPVSIICVYNDPVVRQQCLDQSIEDHRSECPDTEYIAVDNVEGSYSSAGAALNYGTSLATNDYVVFVHQDVYLHSLRALEEAAALLDAKRDIGLLGAIGIASDGRLHGRIRDRVVLLGEPVALPREVDSLDEVLFVAPRRLILDEPLTEAPDMAWHAYAVEYGLRVKGFGLRVAATNIPLTHNSLTTNLDRLEVAHAAVAIRHPESMPVLTTCGTVAASNSRRPGGRLFPSHRWRYRWLKESASIQTARRAAPRSPFVLGDIRLDIDEAVAGQLNAPLAVLNLDVGEPRFVDVQPSPLELSRRARHVAFSSGSPQYLAKAVEDGGAGASILLTNLRTPEIRLLAPLLQDRQHLIGFHEGIGFWILVGAIALPALWQSRRATPFGMAALRP